MSDKTIAIIAELDFKGESLLFLKNRLEESGLNTLIIDTGTFFSESITPDVTLDDVTEAGGADILKLKENTGAYAVEAIMSGVAVIAKKLYDEGKIHGVIAAGKEIGAILGTAAMNALPIGVPKLILSTVAQGRADGLIGGVDIVIMPPVIDIEGINRFSEMMLSRAVGIISGMINSPVSTKENSKPIVAATITGGTKQCVSSAMEIMTDAGCDVILFHASGVGGKTMESLIRDGFIDGVLDLTTTELADELAGGIFSAGKERLEAAGKKGVPMVVSAGAIDMVNFGTMDSVPDKYKGRMLLSHNADNTIMRTSAEENEKLAEIIAGKLNEAKGKAIFVLPKKGFSTLDENGELFWDAEADDAFCKKLKQSLKDNVELVELDVNINDEELSSIAANLLLDCLDK